MKILVPLFLGAALVALIVGVSIFLHLIFGPWLPFWVAAVLVTIAVALLIKTARRIGKTLE